MDIELIVSLFVALAMYRLAIPSLDYVAKCIWDNSPSTHLMTREKSTTEQIPLGGAEQRRPGGRG